MAIESQTGTFQERVLTLGRIKIALDEKEYNTVINILNNTLSSYETQILEVFDEYIQNNQKSEEDMEFIKKIINENNFDNLTSLKEFVIQDLEFPNDNLWNNEEREVYLRKFINNYSEIYDKMPNKRALSIILTKLIYYAIRINKNDILKDLLVYMDNILKEMY